MFKVNNKDTRTSEHQCLYSYLWTYFTLCSSVSIANIEHVVANWDNLCTAKTIPLNRLLKELHNQKGQHPMFQILGILFRHYITFGHSFIFSGVSPCMLFLLTLWFFLLVISIPVSRKFVAYPCCGCSHDLYLANLLLFGAFLSESSTCEWSMFLMIP